MRIAILGTRGIPNRYGGFEQFAEYVCPLLTARGHDVYVYNSSLHPYKSKAWNNVHLIPRNDPENRFGTIGQFMYDFNCIKDARRRDFDIILQLGYTSSSIWSFLFPRKAMIITNMDGFEWKRKKYSRLAQWYLKQAERWAVRYSHHLIADSLVMQTYIEEKYNRTPDYISYGAVPFNEPDESALSKYGLEKYAYNLLIARLEPENNIETIIKGHLMAGDPNKLVVIGSFENRHGRYLKNKFEGKLIQFLGPLFHIGELNHLRHFSHLYFHGHSVGGTNPSLLEAMASDALIVAHDNIFNRNVLDKYAFYFNNSESICSLLDQHICKQSYNEYLRHNRLKIRSEFSWERVANLLDECFHSVITVKHAGLVNNV